MTAAHERRVADLYSITPSMPGQKREATILRADSTRASTSLLLARKEDVDGRDKPGHDASRAQLPVLHVPSSSISPLSPPASRWRCCRDRS